MIRFKDIQIPKPCSVEYDSLPGNEVKRFCGSCKEHVYDFRGKSETYLNEVFNSSGKVCGVYYEDQIQSTTLKTQRPFYYTLITKAISLALFVKTLFSAQDTHAVEYYKTCTTQHETIDSNSVIKAHVKNKPKENIPYYISIYINDILYKYNVPVYDSFIYMPDSLSGQDIVKVIIHKMEPKPYYKKSYSIKPKEYVFRFEDADKITVNVTYKTHFNLIRRKHVKGKVKLHRFSK